MITQTKLPQKKNTTPLCADTGELSMSKKASVLRDKNNRLIENLPITEELWEKTMQEALTRILRLLDASEKFLNMEGDEAVCAGLYTYAVEEYGKLLFLKRYSPIGGLVCIKYKDEFRNHTNKFKISLPNLPKGKVLARIGFEEGFAEGFQHIDTVANFETRLAIFYTDFDDSGKDLIPIPRVDSDKLRIAIDELRKIANATTIP
jgi:AbiV family abortive infection protein